MAKNRIKHGIALLASMLALFGPARALGALGPAVSEAIAGQMLPDFEAETLDGRPFYSASLHGYPIILSFFASWCAVCDAESKELESVQAAYAARGFELVGVLVDPVETPDTVDDAKRQLQRAPKSYPVLLMRPEHKDLLHYVGFPAAMLVSAEGRFSTVFYGFQPAADIAQRLEQLLPADAARPSSSGAPVAAKADVAVHRLERAPWERAPLAALLPRRVKQYHPWLVHFPIALLLVEAAVVLWYGRRPSQRLWLLALWLSWVAVLSLPLVVYTGVSDAGLNLGPGWAFWNGLVDRSRQLFRLESTISLHVLYALTAMMIAVGRLWWRARSEEPAFRGWRRQAFAVLTLLGVWALFAASQVGGSISHP